MCVVQRMRMTKCILYPHVVRLRERGPPSAGEYLWKVLLHLADTGRPLPWTDFITRVSPPLAQPTASPPHSFSGIRKVPRLNNLDRKAQLANFSKPMYYPDIIWRCNPTSYCPAYSSPTPPATPTYPLHTAEGRNAAPACSFCRCRRGCTLSGSVISGEGAPGARLPPLPLHPHLRGSGRGAVLPFVRASVRPSAVGGRAPSPISQWAG